MLRDQRGAVAILFAVAAIPLIGFVGMGVDSARNYMVRSRLSAAVDAAALAGGNSFFSSTRDDDIRMYFHANFPDGYLGAQVEGPSIDADPVNQTLTVSANATVPTTFMQLLGESDVVVATSAEVHPADARDGRGAVHRRVRLDGNARPGPDTEPDRRDEASGERSGRYHVRRRCAED